MKRHLVRNNDNNDNNDDDDDNDDDGESDVDKSVDDFYPFGAFRRLNIALSHSRFCLASLLIIGRGDKSYRSIAATGKASSRNKWPRSEEVKLLFRRLTALLRYPSLGKTSETLKRSNVRRTGRRLSSELTVTVNSGD